MTRQERTATDFAETRHAIVGLLRVWKTTQEKVRKTMSQTLIEQRKLNLQVEEQRDRLASLVKEAKTFPGLAKEIAVVILAPEDYANNPPDTESVTRFRDAITEFDRQLGSWRIPQTELSRQAGELRRLQARIDELADAARKARNDGAESRQAEIDALQRQIQDLRRENSDLKQASSKPAKPDTRELDTLRAELGDKANRITDLENQQRNLITAKKRVEDDLTALRTRPAPANQNSGEIDALKAQLAQKDSQITGLEGQLKEKDATLDRQQSLLERAAALAEKS